ACLPCSTYCSSTPARAKQRAPRPDGPLTHFASPRGEKSRLAEHIDGFIADAPSGWRIHRLSGDRQDEWSVSVSGHWRITFEEEDGYIDRLNLEDYH
ncbi:MAG: type II toxin-antitoxin system RelE/ParE family toxin, partial [Bryobacterales bacterium]|nr:type II toxin-antitoxin system RelE/ParE family toxin [Bryobacterales bacterium]MDE0296792.1 type II toxin-antitoxin system RelE/ParE family toxin [Bryobacterales bacterium]MDE0433952.1 type II toxin-antitoxin system RelE/ParE family toxin [Bryobacterales bacterium]